VSGPTAVVGAIFSGSSDGQAYIYVRGATGWPTSPGVTLDDPAAASGDDFGFSVAVSGSDVLVAAPATSTSGGQGAAYFYAMGPSGWPTTPTTTVDDPGTGSDSFGEAVALSSSVAGIGADTAHSNAGRAYLYGA